MAVMIKYSYDLNASYDKNPEKFQDFPKVPSSFKPSLSDIVTNSNRTVGKGALLHTERLGSKYKFVFNFNHMTSAQFMELIAIKKRQFFIRIYTPDYGTLTMYSGNLSSEAIRTNENGNIQDYKNIPWDYIQR